MAAGMKNGEIIINGNVGMHLGEKMAGGKITVNGDAMPMGRRLNEKRLNRNPWKRR